MEKLSHLVKSLSPEEREQLIKEVAEYIIKEMKRLP